MKGFTISKDWKEQCKECPIYITEALKEETKGYCWKHYKEETNG